MRLKDADALLRDIEIEEFYGIDSPLEMLEYIAGMIDNAPTIEAEPVRHGRWVRHPAFDDFDICSVCGTGCRRRFVEDGGITEYGYIRCPHCGAKMTDEVSE